MKHALWIAAAMASLAACSGETKTEAKADAPVAVAAAPTHEEVVAHGKYIVESVGMCGDCHTPFLPTGAPDASKMLAGSKLDFAPVHPMPFAPTSPALAGLPEGYTEASLKTFLMAGTPGDGSPPNPPMPQYRMNDADATGAAAYLASLPKPAAPAAPPAKPPG